jgi:uncharacterized damage-inducible protein DinB
MPAKEKLSEAALIADQLRRAFDGDAWHGPALLELLKDIDAATATAKPIRGAHSIWELVLHITAWDGAALSRLAGKKAQLKGAKNFPLVPKFGSKPAEAAWQDTIDRTKSTHETLVRTVAVLPEERLRDQVPGKKYDFYHLLHGVVQHELYHAGQIAILKKVSGRSQNNGS